MMQRQATFESEALAQGSSSNSHGKDGIFPVTVQFKSPLLCTVRQIWLQCYGGECSLQDESLHAVPVLSTARRHNLCKAGISLV